MNKCICITLMLVSFLAASQGNIITKTTSEGVYSAIYGVLLVKHPENKDLVKCMVDDFRSDKVAEKMTFSADLLYSPEKIQKEISDYENTAEIKCKVALFLQTPIGICLLIIILLLLISLCCCILRCLCC